MFECYVDGIKPKLLPHNSIYIHSITYYMNLHFIFIFYGRIVRLCRYAGITCRQGITTCASIFKTCVGTPEASRVATYIVT